MLVFNEGVVDTFIIINIILLNTSIDSVIIITISIINSEVMHGWAVQLLSYELLGPLLVTSEEVQEVIKEICAHQNHAR